MTSAHIDPVTGSPIIPNPFGRSDTYVQATPMFNGVDVDTVHHLKERRKALTSLAKYKIKVPSEITEALAVYDALDSRVVNMNVPSIAGLSADEALKAFDDYVDVRTRSAALADARTSFLIPAAGQVFAAFDDSVDTVLAGLSAEHDRLAEQFAPAFEVVRDCPDIAAAAGLAEDGSGVAAWHAALSAARELTDIGSIVLTFRHPGESRSVRSADAAQWMIPVLHGDVGAGDVAVMRSLDDDQRRGFVNSRSPLGLLPAVLAAGVPLSLPVTRAEWGKRITRYREAWESYGTALWR